MSAVTIPQMRTGQAMSLQEHISQSKKGAPIMSARPFVLVGMLFVHGIAIHVANLKAFIEAMQKAARIEADKNQKHGERNDARDGAPTQNRPVPRAGFTKKARIRVVKARHYILF